MDLGVSRPFADASIVATDRTGDSGIAGRQDSRDR